MAREKSGKLKFRDMDAPDEQPYLTKPNAQVDLERRRGEGAAQPGQTVTVNPNPFGEGDYVGTDPIYQNHSTDQNKPFAAEEGIEADMLEAEKASYEADEADVVKDYGMGGVAKKAAVGPGGRSYRTVLPGQEGYDREKAEEQQGPPLRVYDDEEPSEADESEENDGDEDDVPPPPPNPASPAQPSQSAPSENK